MAEKLIERMATATGGDPRRIAALIETAPERYRGYTVPKKEPGKTRLIAEPPADLKRLQRWFAAQYLARLPVHRAA
ncbi:MAG: RNA-directed DNA polymerase, partial [Inquilinus sp.]|nr:RNA-directed DNA polymerase [Inquilinus sp.]